jgi:hypothetical protein
MKLTIDELKGYSNKQLIDLYWFGGLLEADEVDMIINEMKRRQIDEYDLTEDAVYNT